MTLGEFKAWFAWYLESCSASPVKRVKRIEEKLVEVRETPVISNPVYVDKYVYPYRQPRFDWIMTDEIGRTGITWTVSNDTICSGNMTVGYLNTGEE